MKKESTNLNVYKRSTSFIIWSSVELLFLVFLILISFFFLFCCSKSVPQGPASFQLKIQSNSTFSKNTFQLIQQGLKFATYLSNDLNIYINKTIPDTYLQRLDSSFDDNLYQFNVFGFCHRNLFTNLKSCYNGQGLNVVTSFIQDLGMQLGNLTTQNDPNVVSARLVILFYDIINHVCSKEKSEICLLLTYNSVSKAVQYMGILTLVSLGIAAVTSILELIHYCIWDFTMNRAPFLIRIIAICLVIMTVNGIYCIIYALQSPLSDLVTQYQIGKLEFSTVNWVVWCSLTLICLIITIKRYCIYQSI